MDELEVAGLDARLVNSLEAKRAPGDGTRPTNWMRVAWPLLAISSLAFKSISIKVELSVGDGLIAQAQERREHLDIQLFHSDLHIPSQNKFHESLMKSGGMVIACRPDR